MNSSILAAIFHQEHLNGRLPKLYLTHNDNWVTELFLETKLLNALNNPVGSVSRNGVFPLKLLESLLLLPSCHCYTILESVLRKDSNLEVLDQFLFSRHGKTQLKKDLQRAVATVVTTDQLSSTFQVTTSLIYQLLASTEFASTIFRDNVDTNVFYSHSYKETLKSTILENLRDVEKPLDLNFILKTTKCPAGLWQTIFQSLDLPGKVQGFMYMPDAFEKKQYEFAQKQLSVIGFLPLPQPDFPDTVKLRYVVLHQSHILKLESELISIADPLINATELPALSHPEDAKLFLQKYFAKKAQTFIVAEEFLGLRSRLLEYPQSMLPKVMREALESDLHQCESQAVVLDPQSDFLHWTAKFLVYKNNLEKIPTTLRLELERYCLKTIGPCTLKPLLEFVKKDQKLKLTTLFQQIIDRKSIELFEKTIQKVANYYQVAYPFDEEIQQAEKELKEKNGNDLFQRCVKERGWILCFNEGKHGDMILQILNSV